MTTLQAAIKTIEGLVIALADIVILTDYMASQGYPGSAIAYAVEKPWKHEDLLAEAKASLKNRT